MARNRRRKASKRSSSLIVNAIAISARPRGFPTSSSSSKINSRLGIGFSYFSASRSAKGSFFEAKSAGFLGFEGIYFQSNKQ